MSQKFQMPAAWESHDQKVKPYVWNHRLLSWGNSLLGLAALVWILSSQRALHLEWWLGAMVEKDLTLWIAYFFLLAVLWELLSFPASLGHYRVEKRFGLSRQSLGSWLTDKVKGWALGATLGLFVLTVFYGCVQFFGSAWWFWTATFLVGFSIGLAQLAPVILIPIFFKLKPMEPSPLKDRLLSLCRKFGVEVKDVYHLGLGEKTEKGNAAFVGLGRTKRILIGDTLYEKYPVEEVEAVFAHELGHQVHQDLWKGIGFSTFWIYVTFFIAKNICESQWFLGQETSVRQPYGALLFFVVLSIVQAPTGVFQALFSRARERAADAFALEKIGAGGPLANALERLTFQNWGLFKPNPIVEFLSYSHPAPWRRIVRLRNAS